MKIEIETKYNIGDVLYYANAYGSIVKQVVEQIDFHAYENGTTAIMYRFNNGDVATEKFMDCYFDTPEEAGDLIAKRAIENMKKE